MRAGASSLPVPSSQELGSESGPIGEAGFARIALVLLYGELQALSSSTSGSLLGELVNHGYLECAVVRGELAGRRPGRARSHKPASQRRQSRLKPRPENRYAISNGGVAGCTPRLLALGR
jgi:hypothetical protein